MACLASYVSTLNQPSPSESHDEEDLGAVDSAGAADSKARSRRGAVSAEVYSEEDIANYVKKRVQQRCIGCLMIISFSVASRRDNELVNCVGSCRLVIIDSLSARLLLRTIAS
ncbi:hypothetical protein T01_12206 [Trichinella spiralis]|uniref:Uncharacterized protein n=1 Tax=Trichinella spiralis TaxID=6334 RepID=A0A0V1AP33_TRISP|nr:hypothetical protein T01_2020 [Trichinella spiralis]KRY26416.1 hypothetical protein T01_12206 [Trichinella spiralis]